MVCRTCSCRWWTGSHACEKFANTKVYGLAWRGRRLSSKLVEACLLLLLSSQKKFNCWRQNVCSADTRESQRVTSYEAGCDEFLSKPLDKGSISLARGLIEEMNRNALLARSANHQSGRKRLRMSIALPSPPPSSASASTSTSTTASSSSSSISSTTSHSDSNNSQSNWCSIRSF